MNEWTSKWASTHLPSTKVEEEKKWVNEVDRSLETHAGLRRRRERRSYLGRSKKKKVVGWLAGWLGCLGWNENEVAAQTFLFRRKLIQAKRGLQYLQLLSGFLLHLLPRPSSFKPSAQPIFFFIKNYPQNDETGVTAGGGVGKVEPGPKPFFFFGFDFGATFCIC